MKNPELYNKTVDILVQAYFNDTLKQGDCAACAVGNLICHNLGFKMDAVFNNVLIWRVSETSYKMPRWQNVFISRRKNYLFGFYQPIKQDINKDNYYGEMKFQIDSTGYSLDELAKIEKSFERGYDNSLKDKMFDALISVVNTLDEIHENKDTILTATSKRKFNKQTKELIQN